MFPFIFPPQANTNEILCPIPGKVINGFEGLSVGAIGQITGVLTREVILPQRIDENKAYFITKLGMQIVRTSPSQSVYGRLHLFDDQLNDLQFYPTTYVPLDLGTQNLEVVTIETGGFTVFQLDWEYIINVAGNALLSLEGYIIDLKPKSTL